MPIHRSMSEAASANQAGGLRGGTRVALRIASRAVVASAQSALPLRHAAQNQVHRLGCGRPFISWRSTSTGPRAVEMITISERFRMALPPGIWWSLSPARGAHRCRDATVPFIVDVWTDPTTSGSREVEQALIGCGRFGSKPPDAGAGDLSRVRITGWAREVALVQVPRELDPRVRACANG
jgi:hypothetical protein